MDVAVAGEIVVDSGGTSLPVDIGPICGQVFN
jgi:hypothetical protein